MKLYELNTTQISFKCQVTESNLFGPSLFLWEGAQPFLVYPSSTHHRYIAQYRGIPNTNHRENFSKTLDTYNLQSHNTLSYLSYSFELIWAEKLNFWTKYDIWFTYRLTYVYSYTDIVRFVWNWAWTMCREGQTQKKMLLL